MNPKIIAFEYFVYQLNNWYKEVYGNVEENDLSTLKVLKLLFFATAVGTNKDSENTLLDCVFDNFYAMPYGHVESDIYNSAKANLIKNIRLEYESSVVLDAKQIIENISEEIKQKIDNQIIQLKSINFELIKYSSFELVELSHKWYSWVKNYNRAKNDGKYSVNIPIEDIKSEIKIYQL